MSAIQSSTVYEIVSSIPARPVVNLWGGRTRRVLRFCSIQIDLLLLPLLLLLPYPPSDFLVQLHYYPETLIRTLPEGESLKLFQT